MNGVPVVAGQHEAGCKAHQVLLPRQSAGSGGALQNVRQEGGRCALPRLGTDLLIVEQAQHRHGTPVAIVSLSGTDKGGDAGEGTLQIVQPRRGNQPVPLNAGLRVVQVQIAGQQILRVGVRRQGDALPQVARIRGGSCQRHHIHGGIIGGVLVRGAIHMNGDRRNDGVRDGVSVLVVP